MRPHDALGNPDTAGALALADPGPLYAAMI
jgi:hypothetical protein